LRHLLNGDSDKNLEDYIITGFALPGSVYHLHLHLALPPLRHLNCFQVQPLIMMPSILLTLLTCHSTDLVLQYPRFHPYTKVHNDLTRHGKVLSYHDYPNEAEGMTFYRTRIAQPHAALLQELQASRSTPLNK
jgi:hypothetical protein